MAAGSGAIPHPAVSFYTCPTSILTISFQINVLSCTKWVLRGVWFRENVLGGTKRALCEKNGLSNTKSEKIIIPKSPLRRSGDLIYHRYDSI